MFGQKLSKRRVYALILIPFMGSELDWASNIITHITSLERATLTKIRHIKISHQLFIQII